MLKIDYPVNFSYYGERYNSIEQAYKTLETPNLTTSEKLMLMGKIMYARFQQDAAAAEQLKSAHKIYFIPIRPVHDNFWCGCNCKECLGEERHNYYGLLLMEIRNRLIWEGKNTDKSKGRIRKLYEPRFL